MIDALAAAWRAALYCLHPRVLLWSLLPLALAGGATFTLGWLYWEPAVSAVHATLTQWALVESFLLWMDGIGLGGLRLMLAPLIVVALVLPLVVIGALLAVAWLMTPAMASMVARRRFPELQRRHGASWWQGLAWSLACTVGAVLALLLSLPLWLVPPLALLLPALIWGWLSSRVLAYDVLADFASAEERHRVLQQQRWPLLMMGLCSGLLGAVPALLWAFGAAALIFAPLLILVSVWLYTLVFGFAALWFAHFALGALARLRAGDEAQAAVADAAVPAVEDVLPIEDSRGAVPALSALPALPPP